MTSRAPYDDEPELVPPAELLRLRAALSRGPESRTRARHLAAMSSATRERVTAGPAGRFASRGVRVAAAVVATLAVTTSLASAQLLPQPAQRLLSSVGERISPSDEAPPATAGDVEGPADRSTTTRDRSGDVGRSGAGAGLTADTEAPGTSTTGTSDTTGTSQPRSTTTTAPPTTTTTIPGPLGPGSPDDPTDPGGTGGITDGGTGGTDDGSSDDGSTGETGGDDGTTDGGSADGGTTGGTAGADDGGSGTDADSSDGGSTSGTDGGGGLDTTEVTIVDPAPGAGGSG